MKFEGDRNWDSFGVLSNANFVDIYKMTIVKNILLRLNKLFINLQYNI